MIIHAKVAKLYRYLDDPHFSRIMRHIEAAHSEGLEYYDLEVEKLDDPIKFNLIEALEVMGYTVDYLPSEEIIHVHMDI